MLKNNGFLMITIIKMTEEIELKKLFIIFAPLRLRSSIE